MSGTQHSKAESAGFISLGANVVVPTLLLVLPVVAFVGFACWAVCKWLLDRYIDPWVVARIHRSLDRRLAEQGASREDYDAEDAQTDGSGACPECGGRGLRGCGAAWHDGKPDNAPSPADPHFRGGVVDETGAQ